MGLVQRWRRWRSCLQVGILTKLSARFTPTLCGTSNMFSGQPPSRILRCPQIVVLFAVLFVDWEQWFCILLGSFARCSSCNGLHSLFAWAKSGRWLSGCWGPSAFCRKNPMLRILNYFSFSGGVVVLLQGVSVVQHYVFFSPLVGIQRVSLRFTEVPSWKYRWMASVLSLSGLFKHLFCLVIHLLSFRRSVLGSTTAVLLNHISMDWVVLVELSWTPSRFHISSTAAKDYSYFPAGIAVRTLLFGRIFEKFEDLGSVVFCYLTAERSSPDILWSTVLLQVSPWLFESLDGSQGDLASWFCRSCWPYCEFDFSTTRGTIGVERTRRCSSSCVFIHTAFSMQAAGSVLWRTTACDRVW